MPFQAIDLGAQQVQKDQQKQLLAQMLMQTQGMQQQQAQQKQAQAQQQAFQQKMQQVPQDSSWADKLGAAAQAAIDTGAYDQADKIMGVWSKAAEQQAKASKDQADAAKAKIEATQKQVADLGSALAGVSSQSDLDQRDAFYASTHGGQHLPMNLRTFQPGMDKVVENAGLSAFDRAKKLLDETQARTAQQNADSETKLRAAQGKADLARASAEQQRANIEAKESPYKIQNLQAEASEHQAAARKNDALAANGGSANGGGAINFRYNNAQTGASNEVATEIENWQKLDPSGVGSMWQGMVKPGPNASSSMSAFMARKMTPTETQVLGTTFGGLAKSVATMSLQGRPVTAPVLASIEKSIVPVQGDDGATVLAKAARLRQYMENNVRDLQMSKGSPEQLQQAQQNLARVKDMLPTWDQVVAATPSNRRRSVLADKAKADAEVDKAKADQPKAISSDEEYNALPPGAEFIAPDGSHRQKPKAP